MQRILVTGAAGFLGSFLSEQLIENNYYVVGVDNFFRGKKENLNSIINHQNFSLYELDIAEEKIYLKLREILVQHKIDIVINLAAVNGTQYFYDYPTFVLNQNTRITMNVMEAIADTGVKKVVYASSSEVYGDPFSIPTKESDPIILNALAERDSYASSKALGDFYTRLYAKQYNIDYLILRIFNLYGERMVNTRYGQVIPEFIKRALFEDKFTILGRGEHTRSFCYIKDATQSINALLANQVSGFYNLGNDAEISILELARMIHQLLDKPFLPEFLPERPHDHKRRRPDLAKLKQAIPELKFTSLEEGLKTTIKFYQNLGYSK